jgi:hypothetical protein
MSPKGGYQALQIRGIHCVIVIKEADEVPLNVLDTTIAGIGRPSPAGIS